MKGMMILGGIINCLKRRSKYAALLMFFVIFLLLLWREIKAGTEADYMPGGNVTIVSGQENSDWYTVLHDEMRKSYMQCRKSIRTNFYCRFFEGTWEVKAYVDSAVESTGAEWEDEAEYNEYVKKSSNYIGIQFVLGKENITERAPGGFVFDSYEDLFASVRQPPTLGITPPFVGAMISTDEWEQGIHAEYIFIDSNGKAYLKAQGYFFVIERIDECASDRAFCLWEEWAGKDQPYYQEYLQ